jgi:hypothetical protein
LLRTTLRTAASCSWSAKSGLARKAVHQSCGSLRATRHLVVGYLATDETINEIIIPENLRKSNVGYAR